MKGTLSEKTLKGLVTIGTRGKEALLIFLRPFVNAVLVSNVVSHLVVLLEHLRVRSTTLCSFVLFRFALFFCVYLLRYQV